MNKRKLKQLLLGLVITTLFCTACKKNKHSKLNTGNSDSKNTAVITITSPSLNQEFGYRVNITVSGKIEANQELHGYKLVIYQKSDNWERFSKQVHTHGKTIEFNESWENTVEEMQDMELEVIAITDHDGSTVSKKVDFRCLGN